MKIISVADNILLDNGRAVTANELLWNYRSACCGAALVVNDNSITCSLCSKKADVVPKGAVAESNDAAIGAIDALPDDVRARAVNGYYSQLSGHFTAVVIADIGNGEELGPLPEKLKMAHS